jgi:hypothetical protein
MQNAGFGQQGFGYGAFGNPPLGFLPLGHYLNLLTPEHQNSPKLVQFLTMLLQKLDDVSMALMKLEVLSDIDNASGVLLDYIGGAIAGASRTVSFTPSNGVSPILDDNTYRTYIKAKIAANFWDGTIDSLYYIWQRLFPNFSIAIQDNQDMTATIYISGTPSSIFSDLVTNGYIVPRPEGVLYNYVIGNLPAFGFDSEPGYIAGFDQGMWN